MALDEVGQAGDQPANSESAVARQAEIVLAGWRAGRGLLDQVEGGAGRAEQSAGLGGQLQLGLGTFGQGKAKPLFQLANLATDRAVGDEQFIRRGGHPAMPSERLEGA